MSPQETRRLNAPQKEVPALASSSFSLCLAVSWPVLSHIRGGKCDMWVYGAVTHTCREMCDTWVYGVVTHMCKEM